MKADVVWDSSRCTALLCQLAGGRQCRCRCTPLGSRCVGRSLCWARWRLWFWWSLCVVGVSRCLMVPCNMRL
jgi:hypothetical protein